ncbi:hypothetical protein TNCV_330381 [Trichonephila clavipes]|nr:hypothetical protein TNCV_330381 [Trichonephila clavipes]
MCSLKNKGIYVGRKQLLKIRGLKSADLILIMALAWLASSAVGRTQHLTCDPPTEQKIKKDSLLFYGALRWVLGHTGCKLLSITYVTAYDEEATKAVFHGLRCTLWPLVERTGPEACLYLTSS